MATTEGVRKVLQMLGTTFGAVVDDQRVDVYVNTMVGVEEADLAKAARWIATNDEWFPKPARIHEVRRLLAREAEAREPAAIGGPRPEVDVKAEIAKARAAVGKIGFGSDDLRGHDHHQGSAGCPACTRLRALLAEEEPQVVQGRPSCPVCGGRDSEPSWLPVKKWHCATCNTLYSGSEEEYRSSWPMRDHYEAR